MSDENETKPETSETAPASKAGRVPAVTVQATPGSKKLDYRIPASSSWAGRWKLSLGAGVVGAVASVIAWRVDPVRFSFAYLFAFFVVMTVTLGSFFFIIIERLTSAGWSVSSRRIAEFFASSAWVLAPLIIPVALSVSTLFPWWSGSHEGPLVEAEVGHVSSNANPHGGAGIDLSLEKSAFAQSTSAPANEHGGNINNHSAHEGAAPADHAANPSALGASISLEHGREHGNPEQLMHEETMAKKSLFLNRPFFAARMALYLLVWIYLGRRFFGLSTKQDDTRDPKYTLQAQGFAPVATILFALSLTFAAFDWAMSLEPTWFSTIFGVQIFAGSAVAIFATVILVSYSLKEEGITKGTITVEHFHDMGKLLFGFLIFWAYITFSQFLLIWYAALPEETTFYHHRWDVGPWAAVSLSLLFLHFIVPFFFLLSRNIKRRIQLLRLAAVWLIVMHVVEMYWLVMPNYNHGLIDAGNIWIDAVALLAVVGLYLAAVFHRMTKFPVVAVNDPRLPRSIAFENV
jgi:hypothetical protein